MVHAECQTDQVQIGSVDIDLDMSAPQPYDLDKIVEKQDAETSPPAFIILNVVQGSQDLEESEGKE